jgi:Arc/MetJ family transcription regulator
MRLRVEIDDELLAKAKAALGLTKTKAVVETALRQIIESGQKGRKAQVDAARPLAIRSERPPAR